ncbi:MAG: protein kinase domain-containing protein [Gammaproteobacteria bacterium]
MSSSRLEEKVVVNWYAPNNKGNTGSIFKAFWNNQTFAVKSIMLGKRDNFVNEQAMLRKLNALNAPNTIKYFEDIPVTRSLLHPYILTMEWAPSLFDTLKNQDELEWTDRYKIMTGMANGIVFYHDYGIAHRDIKSLNVLLGDSLQAKFCDFDLSRELAPGALCYEPGFTVPWAPPESMTTMDGKNGVGFPGDIYSYATTCWEVAVWGGVTPFTQLKGAETTPYDVRAQVLAGERNPIPKSCPNKIAKLITWGWSANPADRPTAQEFLEELSGGLDDMSEKLKAIKI